MEKDYDGPDFIFHQIFIRKEFYCITFKTRPLQNQAAIVNYSLSSWNFHSFPASPINKKHP